MENPSNVAEFVIEQVEDFSILNADTLEEGDEKFVEQLVRHLPELSEMEKVEPKRAGHIALYKTGTKHHQFFVKEYDFSTLPYEQPADDAFEDLKEQYSRANKYFSKYMPTTVFVKRYSPQKDKQEYLVVQDIGSGFQLKEFFDNPRITPPTITDNEREQIGDILEGCVRMHAETGYIFDLDFIADPEKDKVVVFDTDMQVKGGSLYWLKQRSSLIRRNFGVPIPQDLEQANL